MFLHQSVSHSVHRGVSGNHPGKYPLGQIPPGQTPPPPAGGQCSGRYAPYWNVFLLTKKFNISERWVHGHRGPWRKSTNLGYHKGIQVVCSLLWSGQQDGFHRGSTHRTGGWRSYRKHETCTCSPKRKVTTKGSLSRCNGNLKTFQREDFLDQYCFALWICLPGSIKFLHCGTTWTLTSSY